jgi:hypothetical protein
VLAYAPDGSPHGHRRVWLNVSCAVRVHERETGGRKKAIASVWVLIGWCAYLAVRYLTNTQRLSDAYGPFSSRVMLWPFGIAFMELLFWFVAFRHRGSGARLLAAFMGLALLLRGVLVGVLTSTLYDMRIDYVRLVIYTYVSTSHLAFALFGREESRG